MILAPEIDVNKLTAEEASKIWLSCVQEIELKTGCSYNDANERAGILYPTLQAKMRSGTTVVGTRLPIEVIAIGNTTIPPVPVINPQHKRMLGLPGDADAEEFRTAWIATKGFLMNGRDSKAIWNLLTMLWSGRKPELSKAGVELFMKERFPGLLPDVFGA